MNFSGNQKFSRSMITPEIAAFVVKEYLLPMFESDGKKLLSKKGKSKTREDHLDHNKSMAMSLTQNLDDLMNKDYKNLAIGENGISGNTQSVIPGNTNNKTVFSELKLSEILLQDIDIYKEQIIAKDQLNEKNENQITMLKKNLKESSRIVEKLKL